MNEDVKKDCQGQTKKTGKSKNRKRNQRNSNGSARNTKTDTRYSRDNDPNWYASSPTLLQNAANLAYPYANGSRIDLNVSVDMPNTVPGIMTLDIMPTFGGTGSGTSALNMAANNIYSYVRHMNSGSANYDAPDLLIYILAMDSCYSFYAWMTRLYGVLMDYTPFNYYLPKSLVQAMKVDYDDIKANIPNLRYFINSYALKLSTLKIPATLSYLVRHYWMYSNIYSDEEGQKGQMYMYNPAGFYKYHESTEESTTLLGTLTYEEFPTKPVTFADIMRFGNELLEVNRMSEDHNIMSGDIMKAYQGNVFSVQQIPDNYTIVPTYSEEVLMQIHNATVFDRSVTNYGLKQNANGVLINEIFSYSSSTLEALKDIVAGRRLLNMHKMEVTPADNMVATRLMSIPEVATDSKGIKRYEFTNCASELVVGATIWYNMITKSGGTTVTELRQDRLEFCRATSTDTPLVTSDFVKAIHDRALLSKFRNHPCVWETVYNTHGLVAADYIFELYNFTVIDKSELDKMNEVALLSMLGIS